MIELLIHLDVGVNLILSQFPHPLCYILPLVVLADFECDEVVLAKLLEIAIYIKIVEKQIVIGVLDKAVTVLDHHYFADFERRIFDFIVDNQVCIRICILIITRIYVNVLFGLIRCKAIVCAHE